MFSQLHFVRLRAAEKALREGRLDEAHRLATSPDLRENPRATKVLATLAEQFLARAREHYRSDRFSEALRDLRDAEAGEVLQQEITELRRQVETVAQARNRHDQAKQERLAEARQRVERGSLAAGRRLLEQVSEADVAAHRLRQKLDRRAEDVMNIVQQAERLIEEKNWSAAAQRLDQALRLDAHDAAVHHAIGRLCDQVLASAREALVEGRIKRAADELACLGGLGEDSPARRELEDMIATAARASDHLLSHRYADARRDALALQRQVPQAKWIKETLDQLRRIEEHATNLAAGPLGSRVVMPAGGRRRPSPASPRASLEETVAVSSPSLAKGGAAVEDGTDRLLLLVDGGGSYLIIRSDRARLGRAVASKAADVPFFADLAEHHADLGRVEDDYFLTSSKEVEVAGRKAKHQLLRDGDRVVLSRGAKFTFRIPSRKSSTATLDLSDTTKMPNDVRRVVLLRHHATIGMGQTAHIRCHHANPPLVLFERDGALWLRPVNNGHVATSAVELKIGEPTELCGVSLVLERWRTHTPGSTV